MTTTNRLWRLLEPARTDGSRHGVWVIAPSHDVALQCRIPRASLQSVDCYDVTDEYINTPAGPELQRLLDETIKVPAALRGSGPWYLPYPSQAASTTERLSPAGGGYHDITGKFFIFDLAYDQQPVRFDGSSNGPFDTEAEAITFATERYASWVNWCVGEARITRLHIGDKDDE